jgi:tol-pal system protein YbgF
MRARPVLMAATLSVLLCGAAMPAMAQQDEASAQTLADIRQELSILFVEIQKLKRELSTTGAPQMPAGGGSVIARVNGIEEELQRLTAKTEQLEFRIEGIVRDGTNRIGDLEFRLVELEGGDLSQLGDTPTLGGAAPAEGLALGGVGRAQAGPELAVGEQARFDAARAALDAGDAEEAVRLLTGYIADYPGGALAGEAHFWRGEALTALGQNAPAARAYLDSFSADPAAATAPRALYGLGLRLADLGQTAEACVTLGEVQARFPQSDLAFNAGAERRTMGCE